MTPAAAIPISSWQGVDSRQLLLPLKDIFVAAKSLRQFAGKELVAVTEPGAEPGQLTLRIERKAGHGAADVVVPFFVRAAVNSNDGAAAPS